MNIAKKVENPVIEPRLLSFLECNSCDLETLAPFTEDCGNRSYLRVKRGGVSIVVMKYVNEDTGAQLSDFLAIGEWLIKQGLSAPEVYAVEKDGQGYQYVLIEDLGDSFCRDYDLMSDCIAAMQKAPPPESLVKFLESPVYEGHRRVVDWFVPCYLERKNPDSFSEEYLTIWNKIVSSLPAPEVAFTHMDFHPENFLHLPDRAGVKSCGIIDFQDGCIGPAVYDYTNLLKDIRNDVPEDVVARVLSKTTANMSAEQKNNFDLWYKLLCVQFHFRLAGQVLKLSLVAGRDNLMPYLPRIMRYLDEELQDPMFAELSEFFKNNNVEWNCDNLNISSEFISSNAF